MAQVNKISSFKSFTEIKNQEATMKLREENNAKRQETVGKIGAILDEMGLTSLSELDEDRKQALISKMFGNVSEDEAEDIEDEINKLGEPKKLEDEKLEEGNAFIFAASKARQEGKDEFEFNGKKYKVTLKKDTGLKEGNAFGDAVKKAKEAGETEFEFDGKTYKVEEAVVNEGKHGMAKKLLKGIVDGNSSEAEGIKLSKELADHYLYWINTSPYGKKNENLPLYMLIDASFNWGIERGLPKELKAELEELKASVKKNESVSQIDEARSIAKIQNEWSKVTNDMAALASQWKAAEGDAKAELLAQMKAKTAEKRALESELDDAVAGKDKDLELAVSEAFYRLPKDVIGTELYVANQNLQALYNNTSAGSDVDPKAIDAIIKNLQQVKSLTRKFNKPEEVAGTVYEGAVKQFDADYNDMVKNIKSGYGWIDPEFVADTWENSSDSIDFELVKGEIYKRLIAAKLLAFADEENEEEAGQYVKSLKELGIKESLIITESKEAEEAESILNDLLDERGGDMEELHGMSMEDALDTVETYGHSGSKAKKIAQELCAMCNEAKVIEKLGDQWVAHIEDTRSPGGTDKEILKDYKLQVWNRTKEGFDVKGAKKDIEAFVADHSIHLEYGMELLKSKNESVVTEGKDDFMAKHSGTNIWLKKGYKNHSEEELQALYFKIGEVVKDNLDVKEVSVVFEAKVNEAEIKSDDEFKEYAMTILKKAFGADFDEAKAGEVADGIIKKCDGDYGAAVGMLTSSLGESVSNESIDTKYWADYNADTSGQGKRAFMKPSKDFEDTFSLAVSEWNAEADGAENRIKGSQIDKVKKLAQEFFKKEGYISVNIAQAMIAQES